MARTIIQVFSEKFGWVNFSVNTHRLKRKVSISFITTAVVMLLFLAVVPHHHHERVACIVMERCEQDHAINDEHTSHHADGNMQHELCFTETGYIVPQVNNEIKCKVSFCGHHNHIHLFPVLYLFADFLIYNAAYSSPKPDHGEYVSFYKSAEPSQFHGVRAPPYLLS
jgi:hypothetical protein